MSKYCPVYKNNVLYMDCLDCEDKKQCKTQKPQQKHKYNQIVIGIDQSYNNTGISICADGKLLKVKSLDLSHLKTKTEKRYKLQSTLQKVLQSVCKPNLSKQKPTCIIERIRLRSQGFLNIDYIKSIGALNSVIVDVCAQFDVPVYSVDTRCWKAQVIGTSKPQKNDYGVPEEKWLTVKWVINQGFESSILQKVEGRKTKGTFTKDNQKYMYNNDAADSAGIAMFYFVGDKSKLKEET